MLNKLKFAARHLGQLLSPRLAPRGFSSDLAPGLSLYESAFRQPAHAIQKAARGASIKRSDTAKTLRPVGPATPRIVLRGVM